MAVLIDIVANHTSWDHPWIANKTWYVLDSTGNIKYPRNWRDVAQLNFNNRPEHFSAGFDYNFGFNFFGNLKNIYRNNKSVRSIDSVNVRDYRGITEEGQGMVRYLTNHDVNSSDGTPLDLFGGKKGSMAAFVVVAYMKGIPMIYNEQETGTPFRLVFPFKNTPVDWSLNNEDVTAEYKKVIAFRNKSKAIRRGTLNSYSSDDVCVFTKEIGSEKVLVISNLRDNIPTTFVNSKWKDVFTGSKTFLFRVSSISYISLIFNNLL